MASRVSLSADDIALWKVVGNGSTFSPEADEVDRAIEAGLKFLVSQQRPDGTFSGDFGNTAAIPALAGMAILSKGHLPNDEFYGPTLMKCLDYVLKTADMRPNAPFRGYMGQTGWNANMYAHSIGTLFLSEMSGMVDDAYQAKINEVLPLAVKVILDAQNQQKPNAEHLGGWRYSPGAQDSDLSCSGWALMALRSARLNGAELPTEAIEKAVLYIKRTQDQGTGAFSYQGRWGQCGASLTGAAILCLELCGQHHDIASLKGARFLRGCYKKALMGHGVDYPYYALYYASQGLFQLGGDTWREFSEWMNETYVKQQQQDGSWRPLSSEKNPVYTTSMTVLALTVPYRMLPIYQRDETVDDREEGKEKQ